MPTHAETQTAQESDWSTLSTRLVAAVKPSARPVAITFLDEEPTIPRRDAPAAPPNEHGRTGQVPAGCVFWMLGSDDTFATTAADHANCSVGSLTHGFLSLEEAATKDDVSAVLESGWVDGGTRSRDGDLRFTRRALVSASGPDTPNGATSWLPCSRQSGRLTRYSGARGSPRGRRIRTGPGPTLRTAP